MDDTYPQLQAAVLQTPLGLKQVKPDLQSVALLHFAPSTPAVAAAQKPLTHVFGFWHDEEALQVQPVHLGLIVSMVMTCATEQALTPSCKQRCYKHRQALDMSCPSCTSLRRCILRLHHQQMESYLALVKQMSASSEPE
jgi:hypothetical protein